MAPASPFERVAIAIRNYLALLTDQPDPEDVRLPRLIEALDRLVAAYHDTAAVEPGGTDFDYPKADFVGSMARASASFPNLVLYPSVEPDEGPDQEVFLRDPIDDLSEIADDLALVLWLAENVGENDALWEFRFGFFTHWGRHLFSVRNYLQTHLSWPLSPAG